MDYKEQHNICQDWHYVIYKIIAKDLSHVNDTLSYKNIELNKSIYL